MEEVEIYSWFFVYKEWDGLRRRPIPDKGFEESFREYIYYKIKPDKMSDIRDTGFGLSYPSLSTVPHELDVICSKEYEKSVFELKHYLESRITKELIFTFLGKVIDFYLKNASLLSSYKITMYFVTISKDLDDSIRKLCLAYGIRLIEPSLMTIGVMDYYARDLYQELSEDILLKSETEDLIEKISKLRELYDYSFSDIFRYKDDKIEIEQAFFPSNIDEALKEIKKYYNSFNEVHKKWKSKRN